MVAERGATRQAARRAQTLAAGLVACLPPTAAGAGAWLQPAGEGRILFTPSVTFSKARFDQTGQPRRADRFTQQDSPIVLEYGYTSDLTLILFSRSRTDGTSVPGGVNFAYAAELGGGARVALLRAEGFTLSAQGTIGRSMERGLPALDRSYWPRVEADARLLAGYSFNIGPLPAFVEAQVGYRWRNGRHADEVRADFAIGMRPHERLQILLQSFNAVAVQRLAGTDARRAREHKLQLSAVFDVTQTWSVQAGVFATVAGRNALRGQGVVLGVWRKF